MFLLLAGLTIFIGTHSVRIVANDWRTRKLADVGEKTYKGIYSLLALSGFALIVVGFSVARETPTMLWNPSQGMRHGASLLTLLAFVMLTAAYVPHNGIKARIHHPMVTGVIFWALAHLLANGSLAHVVLFGSFLVWGVLSLVAAIARDRASATQYAVGTLSATAITLLVGAIAWAAFAFKLHGWLIGIRLFA